MKPQEWVRSGRLQYITLWALAVTFVGFALTNTNFLGIQPLMLAVVATVFAATASKYRKGADCNSA